MRVLMLTRYGRKGASSRLRSWQYVPLLALSGIHCTVSPFFCDDLLESKYRTGRYGVFDLARAYFSRICQLLRCGRFDLVWIEKESLPWLPAWFERFLLRDVPYALDYDDAIFHNYDAHRLWLVRLLFGKKLDGLMGFASLVVAGNNYLAERARIAGSQNVQIVPTVVDIDRYPVVSKPLNRTEPCVVWIGSPSTLRYLYLLKNALRELAFETRFKLRVIGGFVDIPGVNIECVPWSETKEVSLISECDVGIMPLLDSPWERGKCGYKLIQYMACGLPVVASPVGANFDIVESGRNGFLAYNDKEWMSHLRILLGDEKTRLKMGRSGRVKVERMYSLKIAADKLSGLMKNSIRNR